MGKQYTHIESVCCSVRVRLDGATLACRRCGREVQPFSPNETPLWGANGRHVCALCVGTERIQLDRWDTTSPWRSCPSCEPLLQEEIN